MRCMTMTAALGLLLSVGPHPLAKADGAPQHGSRHRPEPVSQWFYVSSLPTDTVFRFNEDSGESLGALPHAVAAPFASFIGEYGDYFVAAQRTGEVVRFDGLSSEYKGAFVTAGSGGLSKPTAPVVTPDGKYVIVGDLNLNGYYRFDGHTGAPLGVFAEHKTSPIDGSFMPTFSPYPEYAGTVFVASGNTDSIQTYEIETGAYLGDFVAPGYGGLDSPVGTTFGPDGDFYVSSNATNSVKRYDGRTGAYVSDFVPSGYGGLDGPRAIAFGGRNSDLYVASNNSNAVLKYERTSGAFLAVAASGATQNFQQPRGLVFSARPSVFVEATPAVVSESEFWGYSEIEVSFVQLSDLIDEHPYVELESISVDEPGRDAMRDVIGARLGRRDTRFWIRACNDSGRDRVYTITYRATNSRGGTMLATTTVTVPASDGEER